MNLAPHTLLADANQVASVNEHLIDSVSLIQHGWFIGGALVVAMAWGLYVAVKGQLDARRHRRMSVVAATRPKTIFTELCERHGVSPDDQDLLTEAAQQSSVDSPAIVFVDPAPLHQLASLQPDYAERCQLLITRLFAEPQPEASDVSSSDGSAASVHDQPESVVQAK